MAQWPHRFFVHPGIASDTKVQLASRPGALAAWLANIRSALPLQFRCIVMAGRASLTALFPAIPNLSALLGRLQCEGPPGNSAKADCSAQAAARTHNSPSLFPSGEIDDEMIAIEHHYLADQIGAHVAAHGASIFAGN
jgi:hypothetical protein